MSIIITGTGRYIPEVIVGDQDFLKSTFYNADGSRITLDSKEIISKLTTITGIEQRRYAHEEQRTSDLAFFAAQRAIADADIDPETLDGIIVAQNYGDMASGQNQVDQVPCLAARVKHKLKIKNSRCMAFDVLYGCPGWIQGVIVAQQFLQSGYAKRFLVIGSEILSRVSDPHDRDSMIYADGAAASIIENIPDMPGAGILSVASLSFTREEIHFIHNAPSFNKAHAPETKYIKMAGRKIYEFALNHVPKAMKNCMDEAGLDIKDLSKIFIHQANEKMDEAILERFYKLYGITDIPQDIMPMSIHKLGNSSVATVPTLYDLVRKGELGEHQIKPGDIILFASVGAGMNINAIAYKVT